MQIVSSQEKSSTKEVIFSFLESLFLRYISYWCALGFLSYLWSMLCCLSVVISLKEGNWGFFLASFIGMVLFYLLGKPFVMLFHWNTQKAKQKGTSPMMNWLALFFAIGLYLYPFVDAWMSGSLSQLFDTIENDLKHLGSLDRPESIFTYLILIFTFFIAFSIAGLMTYPITVSCALIFMVIWGFAHKKIVAKLSFEIGYLWGYIKKRIFHKMSSKKS